MFRLQAIRVLRGLKAKKTVTFSHGCVRPPDTAGLRGVAGVTPNYRSVKKRPR
jgi:hypothetical protein